MAFDFSGVDFGEVDDEERKKENLQSNLSEAVKLNADQHAEQQQLATQTGVPAFAVDETTKQTFDFGQIDFDGLAKNNPATSKHLSNFDNAVVAQDDISVMQMIEETFTSFNKAPVRLLKGSEEALEGVTESIGLGFEAQGEGFLLAGNEMGPDRIKDLTPDNPMLTPLENALMAEEYARNFGIETDEQLQQAKKDASEQIVKNIQLIQEQQSNLTPEDLNIFQQGLRGGIESLANMAPGTVLMLASGGRAAPLLSTMYLQTYSSSYGEARADGLTPDKAQWFANINAAIEVGTEMLPTGTIERILTGKSSGMKKEAIKFMIQEMGTEQIATAGQSLNEYTFGLDKEMEKAIAAGDYAEAAAIQARRQAVTAVATVVAGGAQITAATGVRKGIQAFTNDTARKETKAEVEQSTIDSLNEQAQQSKLRERDKESFKQFIKDSDGNNNTTVFIDGAQASLYMQSKTPEEIKADPALQTLSEQVKEASEQGNDVQIPVADFTADFAGTEHFDALRDSMTMSGETVAPFRQEQVKQEQEAYITKLMDEAQKNTSQYVQAQEIFTQVRDQLIDTGAVTPANASIMAQIVPAWATAQASRTGKTVEQVYQAAGLTIEGPQTGERARLEGEMVLTQDNIDSWKNIINDTALDSTTDWNVEKKSISDITLTEDIKPYLDKPTTDKDLTKTPIKVDSTGKILDGHHRIAEAINRGDTEILTLVQASETGKGAGEILNLDAVEQRATLETEVTKDDTVFKQQTRGGGRATGDQALIDEAKGRTGQDAVAVLERAGRGEEVVIVHRSPSPEGKLNDAKFEKIEERKTPSTYLGHYSGTVDIGNPGRHGHDVSYHKIQFKKPLTMKEETFKKVTGEMSHQELADHRKKLIEQGYDGILIEGVNWVIALESESMTELQEDFGDVEDWFAQETIGDKNLFVAHNLSAENLIHAADVGGLAVPSLAIAKTDTGFEAFGEISLLADKALLQDPAAKTFGADIYSPRYPSVTYKIDSKEYDKVIDPIDEKLQSVGLPKVRTDIEGRGIQELFYDTGIRYEYLDSIDKAPKLKYKKKEKFPAAFKKFKGTDQHNISRDPAFKEAAADYYRKKAEMRARAIAEAGKDADEAAEEGFEGNEYEYWLKDWTDTFFNEQGDVYLRFIDELAYDVAAYNKPQQVDTYDLDSKLSNKLKTSKAEGEFKAWIEEKFGDVIAEERIFQGYTPSGNRKYIAHNLDNVVKIMKKELRGGENFNYGVGTIRSGAAPQFRTIKQIQAARGKLTDKTTMDALKEETSNEFTDLVESMRPYYKYDGEGFGYLDAASENLYEMARGKGLQDYENLPADIRTEAAEFLAKLRDMPTEYFESKVQRAVGLEEFNTAVVPKGTRKDALQVLKDAGLKIKTYDPKVEGSRAAIIAKQKDLLFQKTGKQPEARGYYDPANSVIRLTEAADLSTFLHEFAHFMYEMEVNGNTDMLQSINSWYKRNAADVAAEANSYLGEKLDALKQEVVEAPVEVRKQRAEEQGFDTSTVFYHGTDADIQEFKVEGKGKTVGTGAFFTSSAKNAETYLSARGGNIIPVYLQKEGRLRLQANGKNWNDIEYDDLVIRYEDGTDDMAFEVFGIDRGDFTTTDEIAMLAKEAGYKSLIIEDVIDAGPNSHVHNAKEYIKKKYDIEVNEDWTNITGDQFAEARDAVADEYRTPSDVAVIFNPEQVRSVHAEFDPAAKESGELLAQKPELPTAKEGSITEADVITFLDETTTGDKSKDAAIRRAVHEQFARGFETYLMEGKAPSIELRNAFRTFARWLARIYQSLRGQLNVKLDAEMRAVFDRLIATEDQIAAAEGRAQVAPMFTDAAMAGMTEEEFVDYQKRQDKVKDVQSETLRDKLIKQLTRQTKKWWKEEKQDIIDEEIDFLKKERVYKAREQLKTGELKLDHATVKDMAGEEKTDKIGRKSTVIPPSLVGMTAKGQKGVHPDEAAAFLGYNSGSEMIADLTTAPSIKEAATSNAETRMVERHGDIFTDGTIEQQADEAVQNEERGKLILHELKMLAKGTNAPTIDRATIKDLAITNIGKLSFREIHPAKYRKAEIRAAQDAARELVAGNKEAAAEAKLRQVMNYYLGMEATNAKNETTKIVDRMARYNKKKVAQEIQKAENGYWDQLVNILSRFEFRKTVSLKSIDSINLWAKERMETDGDGLVLSNAVLNESYITHWKNIPFSDLQGINDSVKNIEHVARYANKVKLQQEEIDFKKLKQQWVDHINEQDQRFDTKTSRSRTDDAREATTMEHIRKWASQLTKMPFLASWLDGGERAGMSHDILIQQFTDALDVKMRMVDEVATPVMEAIDARSKEDKKRHNTKIWIPEIDDHLMGHQVLAVALNVGNQGNLKKMLLGEGWANPEIEAEISIDNPQLQAVLKHMTKTDWQLVQQIWDQMDILYPQLAEVHRRTTGLTPPKVEAVPIETEFGTFRGGYYPVKYSPKRSHKAEKNAEKREAETESMFNNTASIQSSVNAGATNERTGFYDRIHLSLEVVPDHFNETIHYITHHDAVRQVNRLIQSPQIADAITGVLGEEEFKQIKPWLNDIAKDGRQQPVKTYIDTIFQRLRFGTTLGIMGFKASTGIMQLFGIFTTAAELGVGPTIKGVQTTIGRSWYMKSVRNLLGSTDAMQTGWEFANEKSKVMNHRVKTMDREIKNAMERLRGKKGLLPAVQEASMKHIALIQTYMIDLPTWHAAYSKELSESGDENKAINRADWSVENLQGSGATKDMATLLRNQSKLHTTMTMFMTFFSSLGNLTRDLPKGYRTGLYSNTSVAAKLMFLFTLPVFFEMLMRGDLDEPEGEDERLNKFLTQTALYPLTSIPFVRDAASAVIGDYGYNSSPVASVIEKGLQGVKQIKDRAFTDDEITTSAKKNASKLVGIALTIPGISQAWSSGEHLYDVLEDGEEFTARELLFGPDRE